MKFDYKTNNICPQSYVKPFLYYAAVCKSNALKIMVETQIVKKSAVLSSCAIGGKCVSSTARHVLFAACGLSVDFCKSEW